MVSEAGAPDVVAAAFLKFYVRSHSWDPAGELSVADITASHLDDAMSTLLVHGDDGSVLAVGCLYDDPGGLLSSGGATTDGPRSHSAARVLLAAASAAAGARGLDLLIEADDSMPEIVDPLLGLDAIVVDEVHIVAEG